MSAKETIERLALLLPAGTLTRLDEVASWYGLDRQDYARTAVIQAMVNGENSIEHARTTANDLTIVRQLGACRVCGKHNTTSEEANSRRKAECHNCPDCGEYLIEKSLVAKLEATNIRLTGPGREPDWNITPSGAVPIAAIGPIRRWLREMRIAGESIPLITEDGLTIATGAMFEVIASKRPRLESIDDATKPGEITLSWKHVRFFERLAYRGAHWLELLNKLTGGSG